METKKIKILQAIRQGKIGGGETHVLELCTHLDKTKFEPIVLSFTDGPMVEELNRRGIRTKVIYTEKAFDYTVWNKVTEFVKQENFDLIHAHGTRANSNVFRTARKLNIPLLYTIHGWSFHQDQKYPVRKLRELSEKFLTSKAKQNICVSKSNECDGVERFNMKRSQVIYNAVNTGKFNPENDFKDVRQELGISPDKTVIGYIVRITAQKDPFTMLRAMKIVAGKTDNMVLLMVGDGDLKEKTLQVADELKLKDKVIFESFRTDIPDVLNAIDIYALPSLWEGFPIGILEAMSMKKCVVASSVDGNRELIDDGITGMFAKTGDHEKLAESLILLNRDVQLRSKLAENAQRYVKDNFQIERLVNEVQDIYNNQASA